MRWIVFVLMGANALVLGWQLLLHDDGVASGRVQQPTSNDIPRIQLLNEGSAQGRAKRPVAPASGLAGLDRPNDPMVAPALDAPDKALCTFVGPFETTEQASQLMERLAAMEVTGRIADVEIPAGQGYWVHLQPLESRREALRRLSELQARGVDSYVIPKGDLANGISLGMFSQESLAQARFDEMQALGLDARIEVVERSYKEIWVSIPDASARKLGDQGWQRLLESDKNTDRRQNFCLHVASKDNIH